MSWRRSCSWRALVHVLTTTGPDPWTRRRRAGRRYASDLPIPVGASTSSVPPCSSVSVQSSAISRCPGRSSQPRSLRLRRSRARSSNSLEYRSVVAMRSDSGPNPKLRDQGREVNERRTGSAGQKPGAFARTLPRRGDDACLLERGLEAIRCPHPAARRARLVELRPRGRAGDHRVRLRADRGSNLPPRFLDETCRVLARQFLERAGQDERLPHKRTGARRAARRFRFGIHPRVPQLLDERLADLGAEEGDDARSDLGTDRIDPEKGLFVRFLERVQRSEVLSQDLRDARADVADPDRDQQPVERRRLASLDPGEEVRGRLLAHARELHQILGAEMVEIGGILHETRVREPIHRLPPESLDIQRAPACEVDDPPPHLRGAEKILAAHGGHLRIPHERRSADRTLRGHDELGAASLPSRYHAQHLGDHVPALVDDDAVADPKILPLDLVLIVESRPGHDRPQERDRLQNCDRRHHTGPAHLQLDILQRRLRLVGAKLVRDPPPRALRGEPQRLLLAEGVYLDHQSVRAVRELLPLRIPSLALAAELFPPARERIGRVDAEPEAGQERDRLELRLQSVALGTHELEEIDLERALRHFRGVEGLEASGRRVARIHEGIQSRRDPSLVHLLERASLHVDLAAGLELSGGFARRDPERNRAKGPEIGGDVVPLRPIPPGQPQHESSVPIAERDRDAVHLGLDHVFHALLLEEAPDPRVELLELLERIRIVEAQHRNGMPSRLEARQKSAGYALRGGIRIPVFGVSFLEIVQLAKELVVLAVRDLRLTQDVIEMVVALDLAPEGLDLSLDGLGHQSVAL